MVWNTQSRWSEEVIVLNRCRRAMVGLCLVVLGVVGTGCENEYPIDIEEGGRAIYGTVTDIVSGRPVEQVDVCVVNDSVDVCTATTTGEGLYRVVRQQILPGLRLAFKKEGYERLEVSVAKQAVRRNEHEYELDVSLIAAADL